MNELMIDMKLSPKAEIQLISYKEAKKKFEEEEKKLNELLLNEMKDNNILSYKNENLSIAYTPEHETERFDSKSFKEKYPDVYAMFTKKSTTKASVKITVKKGVTSDSAVLGSTPEVVVIPEIKEF